MFKTINGGLLPQRATKYSAGFDVFANEDVVIGAGETKLIGLGVALDQEQIEMMLIKKMINAYDWMSCHMIELCLRSSLGAKGLILPNGHGVIDIDYKNEIKMIIHNPYSLISELNYGMFGFPDELVSRVKPSYEIKKGDKIGQLILKRHEGWLLPAEYTKDEERIGGFGSTGDTLYVADYERARL
jgi:dUTP pyrophosphatase